MTTPIINTDLAMSIIEENNTLPIAKIRALLTIKDIPTKVINATIKESKSRGILEESKSGGNGFNNQFRGYLIEGIRSKDEVVAFIKDFGTLNSERHTSHYWAMCEMSNTIHTNYIEEAK